MRRMILLAAACGLMTATLARAEPAAAPAAPAAPQAAAPAVDPARLALARELIEASGGRKAAEARMQGMYAQIGQMVKPFSTPETEPMMKGMLEDMQTDLAAQLPAILDASANAYATVYTEQELKDYLAWVKSPSGQSVTAKAGAVQQEMLRTTTPMMQALMVRFLRKVVDRACAEKHCTAEDRQRIDEMMHNMIGTPKSS